MKFQFVMELGKTVTQKGQQNGFGAYGIGEPINI
jgi:hypothetical protein